MKIKNYLIDISGITHCADFHPDSGDPVEDRVWPNENLCCTYVKKLYYFAMLELGAIRLNVNYCFVCGRKLTRGNDL